ncbi:MAG: hypothetical protein WManBPW_34740 [Shewanella algae]
MLLPVYTANAPALNRAAIRRSQTAEYFAQQTLAYAVATNQAGHSSAQTTADIGKQWLKAMSIE